MGASANTAERVHNGTVFFIIKQFLSHLEAPQTHYDTFFIHLLHSFHSNHRHSLTQISHGLGDGYYWFMGVHNFELCNARGGVLNIFEHLKGSSRLGMISKHSRI
ncbi:hypothetical protein BYT27DRAFT_7191413 [Phlegmacium glaucopus]|nr:hypothetical protein BYT27DRAFT_7191413 [Phlegmacium glaucopus]